MYEEEIRDTISRITEEGLLCENKEDLRYEILQLIGDEGDAVIYDRAYECMYERNDLGEAILQEEWERREAEMNQE